MEFLASREIECGVLHAGKADQAITKVTELRDDQVKKEIQYEGCAAEAAAADENAEVTIREVAGFRRLLDQHIMQKQRRLSQKREDAQAVRMNMLCPSCSRSEMLCLAHTRQPEAQSRKKP